MENFIFGVLISLSVVVLINCYPQGAPVQRESCEALQPLHRDRVTGQQIGNQVGQAPYRVFLSQNRYTPCQLPQQCRQFPITVAIRGVPAQTVAGVQGQPVPFRGFIIQARVRSRGNRAVGSFIPSNSQDSKMMQCTNGLTLTHTSNQDKREVRFQWIPEPGLREQVQFVSTIVQNLNRIYPKVYSPAALPSAQVGAAGVLVPVVVSTTTTPPPTTTITTTTPATTTSIATTTSSVTTPLLGGTTGRYSSGTKTSAGLVVSIITLLVILL